MQNTKNSYEMVEHEETVTHFILIDLHTAERIEVSVHAERQEENELEKWLEIYPYIEGLDNESVIFFYFDTSPFSMSAFATVSTLKYGDLVITIDEINRTKDAAVEAYYSRLEGDLKSQAKFVLEQLRVRLPECLEQAAAIANDNAKRLP